MNVGNSASPSDTAFAEDFQFTGFDVAGFTAAAFEDWRSFAGTLDHTLLDPTATESDLVHACEQARQYPFACLVVSPCWIGLAHRLLEGSGVPVASVVGFPLGTSLTRMKCEEAEAALRLGARELDMVVNLGVLKGRDNEAFQNDVRAVVERAHDAGVRIKAILEMCLLTVEEKLRASELCISAGVDFLKTSTGFSSGGATVEDVSLLRGVAGNRCGVKAAGGIRTLDGARRMIEAGANRVGTSSGPAIVESYIARSQGA